MGIEIILTGSFGVGKTSLFNRFIHEEFTDKYYGTIGVRVNSREIEIDNSTAEIKLWDIAGEVNQEKVPVNYFLQKHIILYVIDLNRPFTFKTVPFDLNYLKEVAPQCQIIVVGNKTDLLNDIKLHEIKTGKLDINFNYFVSAKTNENIDDLFHSIAKDFSVV
jgi:small GTP-binding protein